LTNKSEFYLN